MSLSPTVMSGLRAFNHRNYRLFFIGQAISLIGTWMQQVAQSWLVLTLTHDPIWLGVIVAAQFLPVLVFGLFAGVIADSWPKRRLLIATQVTKMILAVIVFLLVVTGSIQIWMLVLIALALGVANAVDMPVRQSFGIEMVGREDLINAVALNSAMFNGARVIGPAIGGIVIATVGIAAAFLFDALSFVAVIVGLLLMREADLHGNGVAIRRPESFDAVITSLREGITYVRTTPIVLLATVTVGVVSTVAMNFRCSSRRSPRRRSGSGRTASASSWPRAAPDRSPPRCGSHSAAARSRCSCASVRWSWARPRSSSASPRVATSVSSLLSDD